MRKIAVEEHQLIAEIARIHEEICANFKDDYETNDLEASLRSESIKLLLAGSDELFVIEEDKLIGYIWVSLAEDYLYIKSTYVDPMYRKQGTANWMKRYIHQYALQQGKSYVLTKVAAGNYSMRRLNEKLGYIDEGEYMKKEIHSWEEDF